MKAIKTYRSKTVKTEDEKKSLPVGSDFSD